MELLETRRLTGPNLIWDQPGSVMDVVGTTLEIEPYLRVWTDITRRILDTVGWVDERTCMRRYDYGVSLAISAPIDGLYAACEINEWAWKACVAMHDEGVQADVEGAGQHLRRVIAEESNPALLELRDAAQARGVAFLSDDEQVSVGLGKGSKTWAVDAIPKPSDVDWKQVHDIPVGLVTGTNGKTTTTRIAASIAATAGRLAGYSSTDGIRIGDELVERGDYSGPGGARRVLQDPRVETAILETARGGLLRRGLGASHADAAVITTLSEDHAGDFGSHTTDELLDIKWVINRALHGDSPLILNADEAILVRKAVEARAPILWFSLDPHNPVVLEHLAEGGRAALLNEKGMLVFRSGDAEQPLCHVNEVRLTLGGAARHNIANALAAASLSWCMGIPIESIAEGLRAASATDNPGRGNLFELDGRQVLVDFAHNPQAMQAVFDLARNLPAKRRLLSFGQAGDRPDEAILELARRAWAIGLDRAHLVELPKYSRGREPGAVCDLLQRGLVEAGAPATVIGRYESEAESLAAALEWAQPGDLVLMMALADSQQIIEQLRALTSS